jgi:hypothetical protein
MGKKSQFNITGDDISHLLFENSPNCMYELIDAVWTNLNASVHYNAQGGRGNHSVILRDNSEYYSTNSFLIANRNYNSTNNTLQVLSGSRLFAGKEIYTASTDNSFIVSNGVIETLGDFTVTTESHSNFMDGFSNNFLIVQGDMPKVIVTNGTLAVNYQSKLRFDLPASGYQEGIVPVKVDKLVITDDSDIIINNALDRINELEETQHVTLVEASTSVSIPAGVVERVNATLPEGSYCYVSDDSKELMIKLYKEKGTMIIVR